ncbi:MAG: hypothetical protein OXB88_01445 [Bacteriovoracales bacterium]|nr:hypothetical protein [Bacteriovoracales bacterium]
MYVRETTKILGSVFSQYFLPLFFLLVCLSCVSDNFVKDSKLLKAKLFLTLSSSVELLYLKEGEIKNEINNASPRLLLEYDSWPGDSFHIARFCLFFFNESLSLVEIQTDQNCFKGKKKKEWAAKHIRFLRMIFEKPTPGSGGQLIIKGFIKKREDLRGEKIQWVFPLYNIAMDDVPGEMSESPHDAQRFASSRELNYRPGLRIIGLNNNASPSFSIKDFFKGLFIDRKVLK